MQVASLREMLTDGTATLTTKKVIIGVGPKAVKANRGLVGNRAGFRARLIAKGLPPEDADVIVGNGTNLVEVIRDAEKPVTKNAHA